MNIVPSGAIVSIAGTSQAVAKGGETEKQATDATSKQAAADAPAGKSEVQSLEAGAKTGDRGGDGRQLLDTFEKHDDEPESESDTESKSESPAPDQTPGRAADGHIDFTA